MDFHEPYKSSHVLPGEAIYAEICGCCHIQILSVSPKGVHVILEHIHEGDIDVGITFGKTKFTSRGRVCNPQKKDDTSITAYIIMLHERSNETFFGCHDRFYPSGFALNPARRNRNVFFIVEQISIDGMWISTNKQNVHLIPGMTMFSQIYFPSVGECKVPIVIRSVYPEDSVQKLYMRYTNMTKKTKRKISQYVLQFCSDLPPFFKLKSMGYYVGAVSKVVDYDFVKTEEDYREMLKVRYASYKLAGKVRDGTCEDDMADIHDDRSQIVIGRYRGKIICCLRMIFPGQGRSLEHDDFLSTYNNLPPLDNLIEISRACTHPDYRGGDLFTGLVTHTILYTVQHRKAYVLISATKNLKHLYERIGFVSTNMWFRNPALNDTLHVILVSNVRELITGKSVNPFIWNYMVRGMLPYVKDQKYTATERFRMCIYRMFYLPTKAYIMSKL